MTAEVAILNGAAVALAADSAVTIGGQKIYNSALKLFAFSKVAPVAIMVYGNASLMGVPWEVLIKEHRRHIGGRKLRTLNEYSDHFLAFLDQSSYIFPHDVQITWLKSNVLGYYSLIRDELFNAVRPIVEEKGEIEAHTVEGLLSEIIQRHHQDLSDRAFTPNFNQEILSQIRKMYLKQFKELRETVFEQMHIAPVNVTKLYDIAAALHCKDIFPQGTSGVVIAGFGDSEIYPSLTTYEIEGVIEDRLKFRFLENRSQKIASGNDCAVIPFGQDDMVTTFMNGINEQILQTTQGLLNRLFSRFPEVLHELDVDKKKTSKFQRKTHTMLRGFYNRLTNHIREVHVDPVLRMVIALPKDELAEMAESLVNLTAFKRRMTDSVETVGGPVDVAVISKGDGLIWVKRKHYFKPELNRHFFSNYYREIDGAGRDGGQK